MKKVLIACALLGALSTSAQARTVPDCNAFKDLGISTTDLQLDEQKKVYCDTGAKEIGVPHLKIVFSKGLPPTYYLSLNYANDFTKDTYIENFGKLAMSIFNKGYLIHPYSSEIMTGIRSKINVDATDKKMRARLTHSTSSLDKGAKEMMIEFQTLDFKTE